MELFLLLWGVSAAGFILGVVFASFVMKSKDKIVMGTDFGKPGFEQLFYKGVPVVRDPSLPKNTLRVHKTDGSTEDIDISENKVNLTGEKKDPSIGVVKRPSKDQIEKRKNPKKTEEEAEVEKAFDQLLGEDPIVKSTNN